MTERKSCLVLRSRRVLVLGVAVLAVLSLSFLECTAQDAQATVQLERPQWEIKVGDNLRSDRRPVVSSVAISADGERMAVVGDDHRIRIYTTADRELDFDIPLHRDWVREAVFHPTRPELYTAGDDGLIRRMSAAGKRMGDEFAKVGFPIRRLAIRTDGTLAAAGFNKKILILDDKGETIRTLEYPGGDVRALSFSPGGKYLAAGGRTGIVRMWDVETGSKLTDYGTDGDEPVRPVEAIAFSSDGRQLAVGGEDRVVRIWSIDEGQLERRLPQRAGAIRAIAFCGSDRLVESRTAAAGEHPLRVWDVASGTAETDLIGHTGTVCTLLFDGRTGQLISGGYDTTVRGWQISDKPRLSPAEREALRLSMQAKEEADR